MIAGYKPASKAERSLRREKAAKKSLKSMHVAAQSVCVEGYEKTLDLIDRGINENK